VSAVVSVAAASVDAGYRGRFAPSPTGPLHAGSLVAALASWLDARVHGGAWLVRVEDVDTPRCIRGVDAEILRQLALCGLRPDQPPWRQSERGPVYAHALQSLRARGAAYPCACTRKDIEAWWVARGAPHQADGERVYPGTCRQGLAGKPPRAVRYRAEGIVPWFDRRLGMQTQDVGATVGDFVLHRGDGLWAYQLAVVVDDAAQGINHIVRGEDLTDNTARQILLQRALGVPTPAYLHTPLVLAADGRKLSKQNGAVALDLRDPVLALAAAGAVLGLHLPTARTPSQWLESALPAWAGIIATFATRTST
jgi:glutamyl-Q tRNA(Asp) synthetase